MKRADVDREREAQPENRNVADGDLERSYCDRRVQHPLRTARLGAVGKRQVAERQAGPQEQRAPAQHEEATRNDARPVILDDVQSLQERTLRENPESAGDCLERRPENQGDDHRGEHAAAQDFRNAPVARECGECADARPEKPNPGHRAVETRPAWGERKGLPALASQHRPEDRGRTHELERQHHALERSKLDDEQPHDVEQQKHAEHGADSQGAAARASEETERAPTPRPRRTPRARPRWAWRRRSRGSRPC